MALVLKLLDEKVVNLAKEMLKRVRNNEYVSRKLRAVIAANESNITAVARVCKISRTALTDPSYGLGDKGRHRNRRLFRLHGVGNQNRKNMN